MERAGRHAKLCNPQEAKRRIGLSNKTDKLDAKGHRRAILRGIRTKLGNDAGQSVSIPFHGLEWYNSAWRVVADFIRHPRAYCALSFEPKSDFA